MATIQHTQKIGGKALIQLETVSSSENRSINVRNFYSGDLSKLTKNNFLIVSDYVNVTLASGFTYGGNLSTTPQKTYNPSTGMLTIGGCFVSKKLSGSPNEGVTTTLSNVCVAYLLI